MTRLRKLDSIVVAKVVISIHTMHLGKVICFAFSDGTVQYRDRVTMNEIFNEHNVNSIMSPHQVGFQFTNETTCEHRPAFRPSGEFPLTSCSRSSSCVFPDKLFLRPSLRRCVYKVEQDALPYARRQYSVARQYVDSPGFGIPCSANHPDTDQYSAILAALSISISPAAYHQMNCDDILAIARPFTQKSGML